MAVEVREILPALAHGAILTFVWMAIAIGVWTRWPRARRHLRWGLKVAAGLVALQLPFVAKLAADFDPAGLLPAPLAEDPVLIGQLSGVAWIAAAGASVATVLHVALLLVLLRDRDPGPIPGLDGRGWRPALVRTAGGGALLGAALATPAPPPAGWAAVPFALAFAVQHELLYRGVMQPWIRSRIGPGSAGAALAVLAPALLAAVGQPSQPLRMLLLGVAFGVLRDRLDLEHAAVAHGAVATAAALIGLL